MCRRPLKNVTCEFVLASPAMSHISCSSYLEDFLDGREVAVQLLFRDVLFSRFVQNSSYNSHLAFSLYVLLVSV